MTRSSDDRQCPQCLEPKMPDFDLCRECHNEQRQEPVLVRYYSRTLETARAVLYKLERGFVGRSLWIPRSVIQDEDMIGMTVTVPVWFAEQENLD